MNCHYWSFAIKCDKCAEPTHLQTFSFSSDGEIRFATYCFDCKHVTHFSIYMERLKQIAFYHDMQELLKEKPLLAAPLFDREDLKLLKDLHVTDERSEDEPT